jgi:hypothetical protein
MRGVFTLKNLTVNITGDIHIHLPEALSAPTPALVGVIELTDDGADIDFDCFILDPEAEDDEEDEDMQDDSEIFVLYAQPGKNAITMHLIDALTKMRDGGKCNRVGILPTHDLLIAYDSDSVIATESGKYLAGPVIVFYAPCRELEHISGDDAHTVARILEELTLTLCNGNKFIKAYAL